MARNTTKIGDVFSVEVDESYRKFFQYVASDLTQLNSDVIRVFEKKFSIYEPPGISEIVNGTISFYAHCVTKLGIKMGIWEKIGNTPEVGKLDFLFRDTNDCGSKSGEQILVSDKWYIWKINEPFRKVGKLEGENRKAEIGVVINPLSIVHRIRTGGYDFFYPGYE